MFKTTTTKECKGGVGVLQAIMAKPCSLVTRARAKFINFFHPYTPMHGDTASRKDDVKPGHDCERWNVCLFCFAASCAASVPGGSVLECLLFSIWKSLLGKNLLCLYLPSLPGFDNLPGFHGL